jgi:hypothetical protein
MPRPEPKIDDVHPGTDLPRYASYEEFLTDLRMWGREEVIQHNAQLGTIKEQIWDAESRIVGIILMVGTGSYWWWLGLFLVIWPTIQRLIKAFVYVRRAKQKKG